MYVVIDKQPAVKKKQFTKQKILSAELETQPMKQEMLLKKQEMQSNKQETQSIRQKKHPSDIGHKLIMQYYQELTGIPSLLDLTSHFVAANIISSSDSEAITSTVTTKSQTTAIRQLLTKIMAVCYSDNKPFCKMLGIMQARGDNTANALGAVMLDEFLEKFTSLSAGTSIYICN